MSRNRRGYGWLLMAVVAALVGGAGRGEAADNENAKEAVVLRFKPLIVMDPLLRQEAGRVLIPADWKGEGTVLWRAHPQHPASPVLTVANPAGAEAIRIYPDFYFVEGIRESAARMAAPMGPQAVQWWLWNYRDGAFYLGNEIRPVLTAPKDYVTKVLLPRLRRDIGRYRVVEVEDLTEQVRAAVGRPMPGVEGEAGRVRLEYVEGGKTIQEDFYIVLPRLRTPPLVFWGSLWSTSVRAEKGRLEEAAKVYRTLIASIHIDLKWYAHEREAAEMLQQIIQRESDRAVEVSHYVARTQGQVTALIRRAYEERQASLDRIHTQFDQYIRGVESYRSPFQDRPVELPSGHRHVWGNALGEYILSDDATFNPNVRLKGDWRQLDRAR